MERLEERIYAEILKMPVIDIHTHVKPGKPHATNLYDIISYHFVLADLEAAGLPREEWQKESLPVEKRVAKTIPYFQRCRNTTTFRCLENLLTDLYGISKPLSPENWKKTYQAVEEKGKDKNWANRLLKKKVNLNHIVVDAYDKVEKPLLAPELFSYTNERMALSWGQLPLLHQISNYLGTFFGSASEIEKGVKKYCDETLGPNTKSVTLGAPIDFQILQPGTAEINRILTHNHNVDDLTPSETLLVFSYITHTALKIYQEKGIHVALSLGARWKTFEGKSGKTTSTFSTQTVFEIANLASCYPEVTFFVLNCSYPMNQDLTLAAKMQPNIIPTGYWWHSMYGEYVGRVLSERLDVLPYTKFLGFFSDAYMSEWVYGKLSVVRKETSRVLAEKVQRGYLTEDDALKIARALFYENQKKLYLMSS